MPRSALASLPVISHVIVVGEDSEVCSKVTVPVIFESPRTVATTINEPQGQQVLEEGTCSDMKLPEGALELMLVKMELRVPIQVAGCLLKLS